MEEVKSKHFSETFPTLSEAPILFTSDWYCLDGDRSLFWRSSFGRAERHPFWFMLAVPMVPTGGETKGLSEVKSKHFSETFPTLSEAPILVHSDWFLPCW